VIKEIFKFLMSGIWMLDRFNKIIITWIHLLWIIGIESHAFNDIGTISGLIETFDIVGTRTTNTI